MLKSKQTSRNFSHDKKLNDVKSVSFIIVVLSLLSSKIIKYIYLNPVCLSILVALSLILIPPKFPAVAYLHC